MNSVIDIILQVKRASLTPPPTTTTTSSSAAASDQEELVRRRMHNCLNLLKKRKNRIEEKLSVVRPELAKHIYDWYVDNYIQLSRDLWNYFARGIIQTNDEKVSYMKTLRMKFYEEQKKLEHTMHHHTKTPWQGQQWFITFSSVVVIVERCSGSSEPNVLHQYHQVQEFRCVTCAVNKRNNNNDDDAATNNNTPGTHIILKQESAEVFMKNILFHKSYWCSRCKIKKLFTINDAKLPIRL